MRRIGGIAALLSLIWLAMMGAGCGGCSSSDSAGGGGGAVISPTERMVALDELSQVYEDASEANPDTALAETLDDVLSHPLIASAEIFENSNILAQFTDGVRLTIGGSRIVSTEPPPSTPERPLAPAAGWIPEGTQVAVINCLAGDTRMTTHAPQVAAGLAAGGYSLVGGKVLAGRIDDFLNLANLGFLYVESHGSVYRVDVLEDRRRIPFYALQTDEPVTEATLARFKTELVSEEMVMTVIRFTDQAGNSQTKQVLSLTDKLIGKSMWFSDNSIAFMNTCNSGRATMRELMSNTNIGLWIGWDRAVDDGFATRAIKRFYTLMADSSSTRRTWQEAKETMGSEGLLLDPRNDINTRLMFQEGRTQADSILPRIDSVSVNESSLEAEVRGIFGSVPGEVLENSLSGAPLEVKSWSKDFLRVQLKTSTFGIIAKSGSRDTGLHRLKVWTLSGADGGSFWAKNRVRLTLANRELTSFVSLVDEPADTPAGEKGPYYFHADVSKRIALNIFTDTSTGGFEDVYLTTPAGTRKLAVKGIAEGTVPPGADGLVNLIWGYIFLDRF